jgi:hypothetical protein
MTATRNAERAHWRGLALLVLMLIAAWASIMPLAPPSVPRNAPKTAFSAERAMIHVRALAASPRPVGSAGHAAARNYILGELRKLGLDPQAQDTTSAFRFPGAEGFSASSVRNVVVRIPGADANSALLFNAHYDGGNTGPAAGDCGSCVAAVIEMARALTSGPVLRQDVILVFSDAEEVGDHGAHAFATQHAWMRDVRFAVNFEAMGTSGRASLYVSSPNNGPLISAMRKVAPQGFGSSFITGMFNAMPLLRNACDLQDYMDAGAPGVGFVIYGDTHHYHTLLDSPDNLDPRTVQSFGDYALGLARTLGASPLDELAGPDVVFFTAGPFGVAQYPADWALPISLTTLLLLAIAAFAAKRLLSQALAPALATAVALIVAAALTMLLCLAVWAGVRALDSNLQVFMIGSYATPWHVLGLALLASACMGAVCLFIARRVSAKQRVFGAALAFTAIGLVLAVNAPMLTYLFALPALVAFPLVVWRALGSKQSRTWIAIALALVPLVVVTFLVLPLVWPGGTLNAFMLRLEGMSGLPFLAAPTLLTSLVLGFALLVWPLDIGRLRVRWTGAPFLLAVAVLAFATTQSGFSKVHPRPESVRYELDATTNEARWATTDMSLGDWTRQFIPVGSKRNRNVRYGVPGGPPTFTALAPTLAIAPPTVTVIESSQQGERRVRLRFASPRQAPMLEVKINSIAPIIAAALAGQLLELSDYGPAHEGKLWLHTTGLAAAGFTLELTLAGPGAIQVEVADLSDGLPAISGASAPTRPANTMPSPGATWDGTRVRTTMTIPDTGP